MRKAKYKEALLNNYYRAGDDHIRHGMYWYREARIECKKRAKELRIPLYAFVAIVASLSPQKKWEKNIDDAVEFIKKGDKASIFATGVMKQKCKDILELNGYVYKKAIKGRYKQQIFKPEAVRKILKGRKIVSFFNNIMYPHISMTVTVDRWAMRSVNMEGTLTKKKYKEIEEVHQEVAKEVGILPHNLQAVVWAVMRGI